MSIRKIAFSGVIGAVYAVLTIVLAPISFGPVQLRIAEALCILPLFFPSSVWGLFAGCVISNLLSSFGVFDVVFGSIATLAAAMITRRLGRHGNTGLRIKILACLPPAITNGVVIGAMIAWMTAKETFWAAFILNGASVAISELIVMLCAGLPLAIFLPRTGLFRFMSDKYGE